MNNLSRSLNSVTFIIEHNETNQAILIKDITYPKVNGVRYPNTQ